VFAIPRRQELDPVNSGHGDVKGVVFRLRRDLRSTKQLGLQRVGFYRHSQQSDVPKKSKTLVGKRRFTLSRLVNDK
jgi:hypothetical protein